MKVMNPGLPEWQTVVYPSGQQSIQNISGIQAVPHGIWLTFPTFAQPHQFRHHGFVLHGMSNLRGRLSANQLVAIDGGSAPLSGKKISRKIRCAEVSKRNSKEGSLV
jgi:hypothetical protein